MKAYHLLLTVFLISSFTIGGGWTQTRVSPHRTAPVVTVDFPAKPELQWTKRERTYSTRTPDANFEVTVQPLPENIELTQEKQKAVIDQKIKNQLKKIDDLVFGDVTFRADIELLDSTSHHRASVPIREVQYRVTRTRTPLPTTESSMHFDGFFIVGRALYIVSCTLASAETEELRKQREQFFRSISISE